MKRFIQLFSLVALMAIPWATKAQNTLTICDGTATNNYVPFYGYYADVAQNGQMIYPADSLTDMIGMQINQMVFYISSTGYGNGTSAIGDWIVSLGTTGETTLSGINSTIMLTEVYSGAMTFNSNTTEMTVSFDNGFVYNGGNLLVQFNHPVAAGYYDITFSGVTATGASYCYSGQRNFLPKVTFSYGTPSNCAKPAFAVVDSVGPYNAYLRWASATGATAYDLYYGTQNDITAATVVSGVVDTAYTLTGLLPQTTYYAWVSTVCGSDNADAKAFSSFTTQLTCAPVVDATLANVSYTAAIINWGYNTPVGFPSEGVQITLIDNTDTNATPLMVDATGTSYTFSGLESGHGYTAVLRNYCQADNSIDTAATVTVNFMTQSCSEVSPGTGTNSNVPFNSYYNYSYTQSIYTDAEMPNIDTIRGIAYYATGSDTKTLKVYMGHTSLSTLSTSSYVPDTALTLVADTFSFSFTPGWNVINFDNNFVYDATAGNLVIAVCNITGSYTSSRYWYTHTTAGAQSVYWFQDASSISMTNPSATSSGTYNYVPAIRFVADCDVPTCFAPMLDNITEIDSTEITVTWVSVGTEDTWVVGYQADSDSVITWNTTSSTSYIFDNLTSNTAYTFYIGSICSDDTLWATATARTSCGAMAFPFFDDFDSYANGAWPPCWQRIMADGSDPSVNAQYHHSDSQAMFLLSHNNTVNLFVTPSAIPTAGDNIFVRYWAYMTTYSNGTKWIKAGVMTDPNDITTFIMLDSVGNHDFNNVFEEREFTTAGLNANETYWVAWMYSTSYSYTSGSYARGAIDDVYISEIPQCQRVSDLAVDTTTADGATIHWTAPDGEVNFYVRVDNTVYDVSNDTSFTFTGLAASTLYTAYVAVNCSGDTSEWQSVTFATGCAGGSCDMVVEMQDSYGDGWNGAQLNFTQNGITVGSAGLTGGNSGTASVNICAGIPVTFSWQAGSYDYETSYIIYDGGGSEVYNSATGGVNHSETIANACPTCLPVQNLAASAVDSVEITFTWDIVPGMTAYLVSFDGAAFTPNSTGSHTAYGLNSNTLHTFQVKVVCDPGDTSSVRTVTQRTACGPMPIPDTNTFENDATGDMPSCWNLVTPTHTYDGYPAVSSSGYGTGHGLTLAAAYNDSTMVATGIVPLPGDSIKVSFWASVNSGNTLKVGVMTNPLYDSTFIPILTIPSNNATYTFYEFNTSSLTTLYSDSAMYVAFRLITGGYNHYTDMDDIIISLDEGCLTPSNVTATPDATAATIALAWTNMSASNSCVVEYRNNNGAWSNPIYVYGTSYTLTNLSYSTTYQIRVGLICGNDTLWAPIVNAMTPCGTAAVPYFENFSSCTGNSLPPCWTVSGSSNIQYFDGGLFFPSYSGYTTSNNNYAVVPLLEADPTKLQITFGAKLGPVNDGYDQALIGVADANGNLLAWIDTLTDAQHSRSAYVYFTVYFPNYNLPANTARVVFGHTYTGGDWACFDNINIVELTNCYPVSALTAHNLNDLENTTFSWTPLGNESSWQVYYDTVTVTVDSLDNMPASSFITVTDTFYTIPTGTITGGGIYNFYVRANCTPLHSDWNTYEFGAGSVIMNNSTVADTVTGCGMVVYDNGGPVAGYMASSNSALVIRSENAGMELQVFGGKFGFGMSQATLTIYDGEGTSGTELYVYNTIDGRDTLIDTVLATSTTGALTITFSAGQMVHTGYELYIHCVGNASCAKPTNLLVDMTSATTAHASWDATGALYYHVYHRITGDSVWNMNNTNTNSYDFTGLPVDTNYEFHVVGVCDSNNSSSPSSIRTFNTHWVAPCQPVTGINVSGVTQNSATLSWTSNGTEWDVAIVNGATVRTTNNPYTFTGLTPNTTYRVLVRNVCDAVNDYLSEWSDTVTFTTLQDAVMYTITVTSNNNAWGTVTGGGEYAAGDTAHLVASAYDGYYFDHWQDGNPHSTRDVIVTGDATYVATFLQNNGIDNVDASNGIRLYPNPASTSVTIELDGYEGTTAISIIDLNGRTIGEWQVEESQVVVDLNGFARGAYFVRVIGANNFGIRKLVIK